MAKFNRVGALVLVTAGAVVLTGCASSSANNSGGGGGGKEITISTDLPLQGTDGDQSKSMNDAVKLYLKQINNKVGDYTITLKEYDNSTATAGQYDTAQCAKNGQDHVANTAEVAIVGTQNTGCTKFMLPILNQDPNGPMLMVSPANTGPGLTLPFDTGEPDKYYPSGKRSFARTVTTDLIQGAAVAQFANEQKLKNIAVVDDKTAYGIGVAKTFTDSAQKLGIKVTAFPSWDKAQPNYTSFWQPIKAAGVDGIFLAGNNSSNGVQLIKDKVAVLGDNTAVKLLSPDGFSGQKDLVALPEAVGLYISVAGAGIDVLQKNGGAAAKFIADYKTEYGANPVGSYPLYAVAALQVILAALQKSDGTRASINSQVFTDPGITIPADTSILGKEFKIDTKTGDTNLKDITISVVKDKAETFFTNITAQ